MNTVFRKNDSTPITVGEWRALCNKLMEMPQLMANLCGATMGPNEGFGTNGSTINLFVEDASGAHTLARCELKTLDSSTRIEVCNINGDLAELERLGDALVAAGYASV